MVFLKYLTIILGTTSAIGVITKPNEDSFEKYMKTQILEQANKQDNFRDTVIGHVLGSMATSILTVAYKDWIVCKTAEVSFDKDHAMFLGAFNGWYDVTKYTKK